MATYKIFMSNLGYLRGINGSLAHHLLYAYRHVYSTIAAQKRSLQQLIGILNKEDPDICCFVEIDKGSVDSGNFNQLEALISSKYCFSDIESKYGLSSPLRSLPFSKGKSSAFLAKKAMRCEKIYFVQGTKRLIYKLAPGNNVTLFFAHFSLRKTIRTHQLLQVRKLMHDTPGDSIFLGDFNILNGFQELAPLLGNNNLRLLNDENTPTFTFHRIRKVLDLCICSENIAHRLHLKILSQPYSDHDALLLEVEEQ